MSGATGDYAACVGGDNVQADYVDGQNVGGNVYSFFTSPTCSNGAFQYKGPSPARYLKFRNIVDGLSTTLFVGEKHIPNFKFTVSPDTSIWNGDHGNMYRQAGAAVPLAVSPRTSGARFGSYHPGICQFVFGDGAVRAINVSIDGNSLTALATRMDGKTPTYVLD